LLTSYHRYKADISLRFLTEELAFHGEEEEDDSDPDAGPRQCLKFLCDHGGEALIERKDDGDVRFATGRAAATFESAKASAFRSVNIKGQI